MQVSWSFHGVSMQVSCWLHAGPSTSMTTPSNLHGTSMEPASGRVHGKTNKCRWRHRLHNAHGNCMKSTSILHGTYMEPPWKLHQLEGATQPSRLDTRNNGTYMKPTSILHGTCMDTPSKKRHTSSRCRYREHARVFLMETIWKPSGALMQIDRKSIVTKLIAQKLL